MIAKGGFSLSRRSRLFLTFRQENSLLFRKPDGNNKKKCRP
ncbi:hypothetical protein SACS_0628 [Parasaccharibacter apium]|uniref:Uncharacterized protein n=1 Tax=Parasaccharibacter apium TaxID=1510841 RepID=A0A7U7J0P0_9PROT|nr:hypothetical protein SACS_0628 [Parasaccharibacter apium]